MKFFCRSFLLLTLLVLAACGQRGPLYLEGEKNIPKPKNDASEKIEKDAAIRDTTLNNGALGEKLARPKPE